MSDQWDSGNVLHWRPRWQGILAAAFVFCILLPSPPLAQEDEPDSAEDPDTGLLTDDPLLSDVPLTEADLEKMLQDAKMDLPVWTRFYTVTVGAGYNDNVVLSRLNTQNSAFFRTGLEFYASRLPSDAGQFDFFISGEDVRYTADVDVDSEQLIFGQAHYRKDLRDDLLLSVPLEYIYQNQVLDVSATEVDLATLKVRGHTLLAHPGLRYTLDNAWWIEFQAVGMRQYLNSPLDDYVELGPLLLAGLTYGHGSEVRLGYSFEYRAYDTDESLDRSGNTITNSSRAFLRHEPEFRWTHYWDSAKVWRSTTRLAYLHNKDDESGYFDFDRYRVSHQFRFRKKDWTLLGEGRVFYYRYDHQDGDRAGDKRDRTEVAIRARVERKINRYITAYAEYEHERVRTNVDVEEYDNNIAIGGVVVDF